MADDGADTDTETLPRDGRTAHRLALLAPGLGELYVGRAGRALGANGTVVGLLAGFVALFSWLEFFPLLPGAVLLVAIALFVGWNAGTVRDRAEDLESFEPRGYNHWTVYGATFLLTYLLPVAGVIVFTGSSLWTLQPVETSGMYPSLQRGDSVLVDRDAYDGTVPRPGDLVALDFPGETGSRVLRVVASRGSEVQFAGDVLYVDGDEIRQTPLSTDENRTADLDDEFEYFAEFNRAAQYVVARSRTDRPPPRYQTYNLGDDEVFLLADNRTKTPRGEAESDIKDSRDVGTIDGDALQGEAVYVAWSASRDGTRWNRIGLRLR